MVLPVSFYIKPEVYKMLVKSLGCLGASGKPVTRLVFNSQETGVVNLVDLNSCRMKQFYALELNV